MSMPSRNVGAQLGPPKLDKELFSSYHLFNCNRQLCLSLVQLAPSLNQNPLRSIIPLSRIRTSSQLLQLLGTQYEAAVQQLLGSLSQSSANLIIHPSMPPSHPPVPKTSLTPQLLTSIATQFQSPAQVIVLLEHEFRPPQLFLNNLFAYQTIFILQQYHLARFSDLRPDMLILRQYHGGSRKEAEVLPDGSIRPLTSSDVGKIGISVVDIKYHNSNGIRNSHFVEIQLYARALSAFIHHHGLSNQFYVRSDDNGIFPFIRNLGTRITTWQEFMASVVIINWELTRELVTDVTTALQRLLQQAPFDLDLFKDVNIQTICGRCNYLDDCIHVLTAGNSSNTIIWDLRLIPGMSRDLAEELARKYNCTTIQDVHHLLNSNTLQRSSIPSVIHPYIPILRLKVTGLLNNYPTSPPPGTMRSLKIPRYSPFSLYFTIEPEPVHDIVFAAGLKLRMKAHSSTSGNDDHVFSKWWSTWEKVVTDDNFTEHDEQVIVQQIITILEELMKAPDVNDKRKLDEIRRVISQIKRANDLLKQLDASDHLEKSIMTIHGESTPVTWLLDEKKMMNEVKDEFHSLIEDAISDEDKALHFNSIIDMIETFLMALKYFTILIKTEEHRLNALNLPRTTASPSNTGTSHGQSSPMRSLIAFYPAAPGTTGSRKISSVVFDYIIVNEGISSMDEEVLCFKLLLGLFLIFVIALITELITNPPNPLAIFFWSHDQLEEVKKLLERNLDFLITNTVTSIILEQLLYFINPEKSHVASSREQYKFFDLRAFCETVLGIPIPINYTWHSVATSLSLIRAVNPNFWNPHFNYMDFNRWHDYIATLDPVMKDQRKRMIKKQVLFKLDTLSRLAYHFQSRHGKTTVSKAMKISATAKHAPYMQPQALNTIARSWLLHSELNATVQILENRQFMITYPEFSIGKMVGARVSRIRELLRQTKRRTKNPHCFYQLEITGLSTSMKLQVGDYIVLLPTCLRDDFVALPSTIMQLFPLTIKKLTWRSATNSYIIETDFIPNSLLNLFNKYFGISIQSYQQHDWMIFPLESDNWTDKLRDILTRHHIGSSWLGERLAQALNIALFHNSGYHFSSRATSLTIKATLQELYLYAPQHLPSPRIIINSLRTTIHPPPDQSQTRALLTAMNSPITLIKGPPGTGKSQTIIALIDEFAIRRKSMNQPVRILVLTFSYAALQVILDKLLAARNQHGSPIMAACLPIIYIHSKFKPKINHPNVIDVVKDGNKWIITDNSQGNSNPKIETRYSNKNKFPLDLDKYFFKNHYHPNGDSYIVFANAHSLYHLSKRNLQYNSRQIVSNDFGFDLIIVDEASQLPMDHLTIAFCFIKQYKLDPVTMTIKFTSSRQQARSLPSPSPSPSDLLNWEIYNVHWKQYHLTPDDLPKVVLVGDDNQLPPVQPVKPPEKLKNILSSVFTYYSQALASARLPTVQLTINYRSHQDIVEYTNSLGVYQPMTAHPQNASRNIQSLINNHQLLLSWQNSTNPANHSVATIMDPTKVTLTIIHDRDFEVGISEFEAEITVQLVTFFYRLVSPMSKNDQDQFWKEHVGIVAPHNAQGRVIVRRLYQRITNIQVPRLTLTPDRLMTLLNETVYSVDKFQGSDRHLIVASMGVSSKDKLASEDEFIYDLNRFNVLTTRAKSKVILVCSRNFLTYLPDDSDVAHHAHLIRKYAFEHCNATRRVRLWNEHQQLEEVELRWKQ